MTDVKKKIELFLKHTRKIFKVKAFKPYLPWQNG